MMGAHDDPPFLTRDEILATRPTGRRERAANRRENAAADFAAVMPLAWGLIRRMVERGERPHWRVVKFAVRWAPPVPDDMIAVVENAPRDRGKGRPRVSPERVMAECRDAVRVLRSKNRGREIGDIAAERCTTSDNVQTWVHVRRADPLYHERVFLIELLLAQEQ
jgi:hypothetical protein